MFPFAFLICSERSGSNLITKIMDAHPEVCGPSPCHLIRASAPNLYRYGDLAADANWRALTEDIVQLYDCKIARWKTRVTIEQLRQAVGHRSLPAVIRWVFEKEARAHGKERLFVKENHAYSFLPFLLSHFPDSSFVYLVRDPRDMASEWKRTGPLPGQIRTAARQWQIDQRRSLEAFGFLKDLGRIHLLKFEDLLQRSEEVLGDLCAFLGIRYSPRMMDFHRGDLTIQNAGRQEAWADLGRPIIHDNFNLYPSRLSEAEIMFVETICAAEMERLGYERNFPNPPPLAELDSALVPEKLERVWNDGEKRVFPPFLEAMDRFGKRTLWKKAL
jgi:hypothetical protein